MSLKLFSFDANNRCMMVRWNLSLMSSLIGWGNIFKESEIFYAIVLYRFVNSRSVTVSLLHMSILNGHWVNGLKPFSSSSSIIILRSVLNILQISSEVVSSCLLKGYPYWNTPSSHLAVGSNVFFSPFDILFSSIWDCSFFESSSDREQPVTTNAKLLIPLIRKAIAGSASFIWAWE